MGRKTELKAAATEGGVVSGQDREKQQLQRLGGVEARHAHTFWVQTLKHHTTLLRRAF